MDILTDLSQRMTKLSKDAAELASALEDAALEIDDQMKQQSTKTEKLVQLQALLKSIGE